MSAEASQFERVTDGSESNQTFDSVFAQAGQAETSVTAQPEATPPDPTPPVEATPAETAPAEQAQTTETSPPPVEEAPLPSPESQLAPIFQLAGLPVEQAQPQANEVIYNFAVADPINYRLMANAVLATSPSAIQSWALEKMGVQREDIARFTDWRAKGGGELPEPTTYAKFEETVIPLEGGADGTQWVRLANNIELDLNDARDKAHYELEKRLYDAGVQDKMNERARLETEQRETAERQAAEAAHAEQALIGRAEFYESGRYTLVDNTLNAALANLAPDDKMRGDMFRVYARDQIQQLPEVQAIGRQAMEYVKEGAGFVQGPDGQWQMSGRVKELADAQDRVIRKALNGLVDSFNKDILRLNRAELAATSTAPRIPPTAPPVNASIQPPQSFSTFDDIFAAAQQADRAAASR